MPNDCPEFLKFLPGSEDIIIYEKQKERAKDIINNASFSFYCDFNQLDRLAAFAELEKKNRFDKSND